ncbi:MAG: hypothetical protein GEV10_18870 [Streptosporangiales bacterium]|nr:hypothetical protein [Streptosporangiales bacterium]
MVRRPEEAHEMVEGATRRLSEFAAGLRLDDVPADVVSRIKTLILDQLGAEVLASGLPWVSGIRSYATRYSRSGEALLVGTGESLDAEYASLVNATAGHGFEIDDYHPAPTHIGCVAVPSAMAVGQEQRSSGRDVLEATVVAFEMIARVADATMPSMIFDRGFHATGAHGVFGSAAAAACLMGLSPQESLMALALAGSHASGTVEYTQTGGDVKRFHAGVGAAGGIRSARAAAVGMTGPPTVLEGKKGILLAFSAAPDVDALTEGLGDKWSLMATAIKPYTACGLLNPQIDAYRAVMARNGLQTSDVERVVVGGDRFAVVHVGTIGPEPTSIVGAQFSTHYSLAMAAVLGANDFQTYQRMEREGFCDPAVLEMAHRIELVLDSECDARYPDISKATISIRTRDGRTFDGEAYSYRELPREEVETKFRKLVSETLTDEQADGVVDSIARLEDLPDVAGLARLLVRRG